MEEQIRACCLAISLIRLFFKFFFFISLSCFREGFFP